MKSRLKKKYHRRLLILCIILFIVFSAALFFYPYVSINLWISRDSGVLRPYQRLLIDNEKSIYEYDSSPDTRTRLIENAIAESNAKDRIVLNLSRSDIRFSFFHRKAYVKIFLKTAIPDDRTKTTSIKVLNVLVKRGNIWKVLSMQDLSIE
jgi:hypothetical protein